MEEPAPTRARRRPGWAVLLPVLVGLVAVGAVVVAGTRADDHGRDRDAATSPLAGVDPDAVAISSDAPRLATLDQLTAAADVVVRGEVVATERGRWFGAGEGRGSRLQSRFVTLRVDDVLAGSPPAAGTVLLEEEGWLEDGAPVVVDGAAPSRTGDRGIWFLVDGGDPDVGAYVVVSAQGRYLDGGGGDAVGAAGDDPLVAELSARSLDDLAADLRG